MSGAMSSRAPIMATARLPWRVVAAATLALAAAGAGVAPSAVATRADCRASGKTPQFRVSLQRANGRVPLFIAGNDSAFDCNSNPSFAHLPPGVGNGSATGAGALLLSVRNR